jgi:hypothetical protein
MNKTLFAAFADRSHANMAIEELEAAGYNAKEMSVIGKHISSEDGRGISDAHEVSAGAVSGATTGGVIGGLTGLLAGAGIFPALAGLLIGGPVAVALGLTGMAATAVSGVATGALAGTLIGALSKIGLPEEHSQYYEGVVEHGGIVLAVPVHAGEEVEVHSILRDNYADQLTSVDLPEEMKAPIASTSAPQAIDGVQPEENLVVHRHDVYVHAEPRPAVERERSRV